MLQDLTHFEDGWTLAILLSSAKLLLKPVLIKGFSYTCRLDLTEPAKGSWHVLVSYGSRQESGSCARSTHDAIGAALRFLSMYQF